MAGAVARNNGESSRFLVLKSDVVVPITNVLLVLAVAYAFFKLWDLHPLYGRNKGPRVYPVLGSTIPFLLNRHRVLDYHTDLLQNAARNLIYTIRGVRPVNRCSYITTDPKNIEYILRTNLANFPKGKFIDLHLRSIVGDGIFNADDHLWKIERQVASREFPTRYLKEFWLETVHAVTKEGLLPTLSTAAQSGRIVDFQDILSRFSFDTICRQGFGVNPGYLSESLPTVKFAEAFDTAMKIIFRRSQSFSHLLWALKVALDVGDAKKLRLALSVVDDFALGVIENRRKDTGSPAGSTATSASCNGADGKELGGGSCRNDLLSRFMRVVKVVDSRVDCKDQNKKNEVIWISSSNSDKADDGTVLCKSPNNFLRDMIISFVLAGKDTSTAALSWFFWLLATHPEVDSAIQTEISAVFSRRQVDSDINVADDSQEASSLFSFEELKGMHYLTAAIMESMRLYPPVPFNFRTVRGSDVLPDGTELEAGSIVGYHAFAMGRMEHLWGENCRNFKPQRWLNNEGAFVPVSPFKFPIFHAGRRMCLGKDAAMMQMKATCAAVLRNFTLEVLPDFRPEYLLTLTLRLKHGLPMRVQRRGMYS